MKRGDLFGFYSANGDVQMSAGRELLGENSFKGGEILCFCLEIKTTGNVILMLSAAFVNSALVLTPTCLYHMYLQSACVTEIRVEITI